MNIILIQLHVVFNIDNEHKTIIMKILLENGNLKLKYLEIKTGKSFEY
jgi:hypothetical protein